MQLYNNQSFTASLHGVTWPNYNILLVSAYAWR